MQNLAPGKLAHEYKIHKRDTSSRNQIKFWRRSVQEEFSGLEFKVNSLEDVSSLPTKVLTSIILNNKTEASCADNIKSWNKEISKENPIVEDAMRFFKEDNLLYTSPDMAVLLSVKSGEGHSHEGHGKYPRPRPNTTMNYISDVIESSKVYFNGEIFIKENFRNNNQHAIDNIVYAIEDWTKNIMANTDSMDSEDEITVLTNPDGMTPLNGFSFYEGLKINMLEFMRGFYFASLMDNFEDIRAEGFEKYGYNLGGGESHLTDMERLKRSGIHLTDLSKMDHHGIYGFLNHTGADKKLDILYKTGIFLDKQFNWENFNVSKQDWRKIKEDSSIVDTIENSGYLGQYMRDSKGHGVGDDIAIYLASILPNTFREEGHIETPYDMYSRMLGALMADQIDTLEKDSRLYFPGGQDEFAGKYINELFKECCSNKKFRETFDIETNPNEEYNLVDRNAVVDYTMASANNKKENVHSSQRWFYKNTLGVSSREKTCGLKEEMKYMYNKFRNKNSPSLPAYFRFNPNRNSENLRFTFRQIPLQEITDIFDRRTNLVIDPDTREERLAEFYSQNN